MSQKTHKTLLLIYKRGTETKEVRVNATPGIANDPVQVQGLATTMCSPNLWPKVNGTGWVFDTYSVED
jgi:hypothetical protein